MMISKRGLLGAFLLLALAACGKREEEMPPTVPDPVLRSVSVSVSEVVVPTNGSVQVPFVVEEAAYVPVDVRLMLSGGQTTEAFSLTNVVPDAQEGHYLATIQDKGTVEVYNIPVCIAIMQRDPSTGNEVLFSSTYFTVSSAVQQKRLKVETGLPVVYVDTEGKQNITSKTEYLSAEMYIKGTEALPGLQEAISCSIRGRGNTTWEWPKKPYLIKLDEKTSLLGLPMHKRWVLLANFMDRTMMRNLVSMHVASLTSLAWTPRCVPVELVLNGKHKGSYLLIEQVRVDKNRVAITEMSRNDNDGEAVTGGYLLELDFHYDNEFQWINPHGRANQVGSGIPFAVKSPDPEDITDAQKAYIQNYIAQVADVLYGNNFAHPEEGYAQYLDVDSFIDYWLVFEVMCNHELANPGSVYFHKDRGGKLTAGPCWDFDWGVLSFNTSNGRNELVNGKAIWYERLFQDPVFKKKVQARFLELLPKLEAIPDYMDTCEEYLTESARLNFAMWNPADDRSMNGGRIINGDENLSFHEAVQRLKDNYKTHLRVMQEKLF